MINSASRRNENPADGRPLLGDDLTYFRGGLYFIGGIGAFSIKASEKKLHRAFRQMLVTVPLLRTRVVGDPEGSPVFQAIEDPDEWPKLQILQPGGTTSTTWTDEEALACVRDFKNATEAMFLQDKETQRTSLRFAICRGKSKLYTVIVVPHLFLDGTGVGIAALKTIVYAKLPHCVWPLLNFMWTDRSVPIFMEMALKNDYHLYREVDGSLVKHIDDPNGLSFGEVDPSTLGGFDRTVVGQHKKKNAISQFKKAMKAQNLTISIAFMGLAIKVIGALTKDRSFESVQSCLGCDARYLGKWGDGRDRQAIGGNYAYPFKSVISAELVREGSWQEIALQVQNHLKRIRDDIEYRLHYMQYCLLDPSKFCGYFVGVSSVMIPNSLVRYGLGLSELDVFINFGPIPRCWFYLITIGSNTQVAMDIMLPGVKKEEVRLVLQDTLKNSDFEPLFNDVGVLNG
mmetsp:Transcript_1339/g.2025  ORF Transcript_1339/g.2025 Transcript_1339/m.2025 type:complete len:457 (+) Transcript_1339:97-1467(+)